jgi:catechol 2,3-dioxygenase-like lactoylglutathione lyase family enzyme
MMFSHVMLGSNSIDRSRSFYDAIFAEIGVPPAMTDPRGRLIYRHNGGTFIITPPINGEPACHANGGTIGFAANTTDAVDAWHQAGVAAGGKPIENPPGWREGGGRRLYLAYLRDPDGNKICAMHVGQ